MILINILMIYGMKWSFWAIRCIMNAAYVLQGH